MNSLEKINNETKIRYFDSLVERKLLTSFRETAKELGIKENKLIKLLLEGQLIYRDKRGKLLSYAMKNIGFFEVKEYVNQRNGWVSVQTLITPKGKIRIMELIREKGEFHVNFKS